ncbi:MAG: SIR2 family protein, partial [Bacteroidota bacterium]
MSDTIRLGNVIPLINAINSGRAVVYVGAGASMPVGLPDWRTFLSECVSRAEAEENGKKAGANPASPHDGSKWVFIRERLDQGDYLICAEMLQMEIGQAIEQYVWDIFGENNNPSPIHREIARIPFSMAITTNYDRLLESAYPGVGNIYTWMDPLAFFSAIKKRRMAIVKIHGDVGNSPSLVLTRTHYRDLMHVSQAFNRSLATLLALRTFLFVGSSLRDHDLLRLLDESKLTYGDECGPHYAILFEDEVSDSYLRLLEKSYGINVILCGEGDGRSNWRTDSVCSVLRSISGKASAVKDNSKYSDVDDPDFTLVDSTSRILSTLMQKTGSDRGIVAFSSSREIHSLNINVEVFANERLEIRRTDREFGHCKPFEYFFHEGNRYDFKTMLG